MQTPAVLNMKVFYILIGVKLISEHKDALGSVDVRLDAEPPEGDGEPLIDWLLTKKRHGQVVKNVQNQLKAEFSWKCFSVKREACVTRKCIYDLVHTVSTSIYFVILSIVYLFLPRTQVPLGLPINRRQLLTATGCW